VEQIKALLASWFRSFLAGGLTLYLANGETDLKSIGMAGIAAVAPVILRWANKSDAAFGLTK